MDAEARVSEGWVLAQGVVGGLGLTLFLLLLSGSPLGLDLFWNLLVPVAPLLVVVAPGLWRNVCPLAQIGLSARRHGGGARSKLTPDMQHRLQLGGVLLLLAIVPARHLVLDASGPATALVLLLLAAGALGLGLVYEWKSAWCAGLCPVHPVERLYGSRPAATVANAQCTSCARCVAPCPDSTPAITPRGTTRSWSGRLVGALMVGGFPGFVWGWFHVADVRGPFGGWTVLATYAWPLAGTALSLLAWRLWERCSEKGSERLRVRAFAALAVTTYYWYRLPALVGLGLFPGDGMLVDLSGSLPAWWLPLTRAIVVGFFATWFLPETTTRRSWSARPEYAPMAV